MFVEDLLQRHMGLKVPEHTPERPPIEPIRPAEHQFKPRETEVEGRGGQVLIVRPKEEELKPLVKRLEDLPSPGARLRYLLSRAHAKPEPQRLREVEPRGRERPEPRERARREEGGGADTAKTADEAPGKTSDTTPGKTTDSTPTKTSDNVPTDRTREIKEREVVVLDRDALRAVVPALPAYVFAMPAVVVLPLISRMVGMPVALAPGLPKPAPREAFGSWLDRVFAGTGFSWRSLAAQKEAFVFA
jgi:hypothetical protein